MPDEPMLREKARDAIRTGRLPTSRPSRVFGGPGSGQSCALCAEIVPRTETEFEIEFNRHGLPPGIDRYHLHQRCFAAWEFERTKASGSSN